MGHSLGPGHVQGRLVLLFLSLLNEKGNLVALGFLDVSLQTSMCRSSKGISRRITGKHHWLPHTYAPVGGEPRGALTTERVQGGRGRAGAADHLPLRELLLLPGAGCVQQRGQGVRRRWGCPPGLTGPLTW